MAKIQLVDASDYIAAGIAPTAGFVGADDGTIGSPTGFEPVNGYFIRSENAFPAAAICWETALNQSLFPGDGAGSPLAELLFQFSVRLDSSSPDASNRTICFLGNGNNSFNPDAGLFSISGLGSSNPQRLDFFIGESDGTTFAQYQIFNTGIVGTSSWHKIRMEYKQSIAGTYSVADMDVFIDDILVAPDGSFGGSGNWDSSVAHGYAIGGINNGNSFSLGSAMYGDILISNDITDQIVLNSAPTGSINSIIQRT